MLAKEREVGAHQVEIEVLQAEKSKKEPVAKELFNRTLQQDTRLKELLAGAFAVDAGDSVLGPTAEVCGI